MNSDQVKMDEDNQAKSIARIVASTPEGPISSASFLLAINQAYREGWYEGAIQSIDKARRIARETLLKPIEGFDDRA